MTMAQTLQLQSLLGSIDSHIAISNRELELLTPHATEPACVEAYATWGVSIESLRRSAGVMREVMETTE